MAKARKDDPAVAQMQNLLAVAKTSMEHLQSADPVEVEAQKLTNVANAVERVGKEKTVSKEDAKMILELCYDIWHLHKFTRDGLLNYVSRVAIDTAYKKASQALGKTPARSRDEELPKIRRSCLPPDVFIIIVLVLILSILAIIKVLAI